MHDGAFACNDGDGCTKEDTCNEGKCTGTLCPGFDLTHGCINVICYSSGGSCETTFNNGLSCNDGDACTEGKCAGAPRALPSRERCM